MANRTKKIPRRSDPRAVDSPEALPPVRAAIDAAVAEAFAEGASDSAAASPRYLEAEVAGTESTTAAAPEGAEPTELLSGAAELPPTSDLLATPGLPPLSEPLPRPAAPPGLPSAEPVPARMLNEFVYCPRLFYYEFVEGVFVDNADTLRGAAIHARVDAGSGAMPAAHAPAIENQKAEIENEIIHSRSVSLSSERLGVVAKMDLVEVRPPGPEQADLDLFNRYEVCPVDYKAGAPREGDAGKELWDTDKMQLALQCLILRDNGYLCQEGVIYYRATRQRVRLPLTPELEAWVEERIDAARVTASGPIPPPLVDSPKCPRCSLVTVCLPDETRMLSGASFQLPDPVDPQVENLRHPPAARRLIAMRDDRRALYLSTPGLYVGRKDDVLQIREAKTPPKKAKAVAAENGAATATAEAPKPAVQEVRINDVSHLALFGNIQVSTSVIQALCEHDIPVSYFSMGGWFYGITRGHSLKNVFLRVEQFRHAADPMLSRQFARLFVRGKIRNQRTMLMRNHVEPPAHALLRLKRATDECLAAQTLASLLGMEGAAAAVYFEQFNGMIKIEDVAAEQTSSTSEEPTSFRLDFHGRNRRPPADPVNALLSLAYSLLAKDCTIAALAVGLDPYVGFYHQPRFGRPAMALDLMEEFRPLIADSAVLSAINTRMITAKDFVRAGKAVNLTAAGRRNFFTAYELRMSQLIAHPVFEYKVSYRRALELQFRILARVLTGEISQYQPFMTR